MKFPTVHFFQSVFHCTVSRFMYSVNRIDARPVSLNLSDVHYIVDLKYFSQWLLDGSVNYSIYAKDLCV
jgi:hypothetical protein